MINFVGDICGENDDVRGLKNVVTEVDTQKFGIITKLAKIVENKVLVLRARCILHDPGEVNIVFGKAPTGCR